MKWNPVFEILLVENTDAIEHTFSSLPALVPETYLDALLHLSLSLKTQRLKRILSLQTHFPLLSDMVTTSHMYVFIFTVPQSHLPHFKGLLGTCDY